MQTAVRGIAAALALACIGTPARAQQAPPEGFQAAYNCGQDEYKLANYAKARECFQQAIELAPNIPGSYRWMAAVAFAEGKHEECLEHSINYVDRAQGGKWVPAVRELHASCREALNRPAFDGVYGGGGAIYITVTDDSDTAIAGCSIRLNGLKSGATPMRQPRVAPAGATDVELECEGYLPATRQQLIYPEMVADVQLQPQRDPSYVKQPLVVPTGPVVTTGWIILQSNVPAATIEFDGKQVSSEANGKIEAEAGVYTLTLCAAEHECWRRRVRVYKGQKRLVQVTLQRTSKRQSQRRMGYIFLGTAAAFATSGVAFGYLHHSDLETAQDWADAEIRRPGLLADDCTLIACHTREQIDAKVDDAKTNGLISTMSFGAAAAALGVSIYFFIQERPAERAGFELPMAVVPLGTDGVAATYTTEFDW